MLKKDNVDEDWKVLGKNLQMLRKCWGTDDAGESQKMGLF